MHGSNKLQLDYIIHEWHYPDQHLSIQVRLPSRINVHSQLIHCVSTNQDEYVLSLPYSSNFQTAEETFCSYVGEGKESLDDVRVCLNGHAKVISQEISMSKLLKRDPTKELWVDMGIKLPTPTSIIKG